MLKEVMFRDIDGIRNEMTAMADDIFDHPEIGLEEFHAQKVLTDWLEKEGFAVERGVVGVETAFKAVYRHGEGGPNIGLLCEYDALPGIGHACGHHMQGPSILAAAKALKDAEIRKPYTITVYGTPAEESVSGKIRMIQNGCTFEELDGGTYDAWRSGNSGGCEVSGKFQVQSDLPRGERLRGDQAGEGKKCS